MTALADAPAEALQTPRRRRRLGRTALLLVVVVTAGFLLASRLDGPEPVRSVLLGQPALAGPTLDDGPFNLADWRGQVVLVNVWASWCVPCRREQPLLVSAYEQLAPRGLKMVGINLRDRPQDAQAFLGKYGNAPWPSVVDSDGRHAIDLGTFGLPETYLVDRDGNVVSKAVGELSATWIQDNVVPLLSDAP